MSDLPWLDASLRLISLVGIVLALGGAMAEGWLPSARPQVYRLRDAVVLGCSLLVLGAFVQAGHVLWSLSGGDPRAARAMLAPLVEGATGRTLEARMAVALILGIRAFSRRPLGAAESTLYGILLAACLAWDSHASDLTGQLKLGGLTVDTAHVLLASSWLGALLVIVWLNQTLPDATGLIRQFSRLASVVMPAAVVCGLANVLLHLPAGGISKLAAFDWGRLAILKAILVLGILVLAYGLRRRTRELEADCQSLPGAMRRRIAVEAAIGVVVLGVTGLLSQSDPMPPMPGQLGSSPSRPAISASAAPSGPGGPAMAMPN